jgi:hypothetical protein
MSWETMVIDFEDTLKPPDNIVLYSMYINP